MQSRVNKRKYVHVGDYLAHLFIDLHQANIARVGRNIKGSRTLVIFVGGDLSVAVSV